MTTTRRLTERETFNVARVAVRNLRREVTRRTVADTQSISTASFTALWLSTSAEALTRFLAEGETLVDVAGADDLEALTLYVAQAERLVAIGETYFMSTSALLGLARRMGA